MSNIWFISDTHFCQNNILHYSNRPFANADEMDETIIENWNQNIQKGDRVYFLGDFAFAPPKKAKHIMDRLNGQVYYITGNHDKKENLREYEERCVWIDNLKRIKISDADTRGGKQHIVLCHYAIREWEGKHYFSWHCAGHSHASLYETRHDCFNGGLCLDVGIDSSAYYFSGRSEIRPEHYKPFSYDDIKCIMTNKQNLIENNNTLVHKDHHQPK